MQAAHLVAAMEGATLAKEDRLPRQKLRMPSCRSICNAWQPNGQAQQHGWRR